ncbi:unnamed protein product [Oppiella nova]|uniref:Small ribosomal subunit protein mS33 n=1 Tax=Oppiella nova TaxID=334625 RepID=A0A7R9LN81_9ACAR|nr:unnamed protein product [Oppiella nova]CAG2165301.1 unnamed protein product [Oppiella nova]
MSSKYSQRMARLSQKIFGQYRRPPMPPDIQRHRTRAVYARHAFAALHHRNEAVIDRMSSLPLDLDCQRNPLYYPPHPQVYVLINRLREMGLFRDEHLDFKEEMVRQKILRGKRIFAKYSDKSGDK